MCVCGHSHLQHVPSIYEDDETSDSYCTLCPCEHYEPVEQEYN